MRFKKVLDKMARARATTTANATCGIVIGQDTTCNARTTNNADFCTRNERNRCVFANNPAHRNKKYTLNDVTTQVSTATDRVAPSRTRFDNHTLRVAVREWIVDRASAQRRYGPIGTWNTTDVTDMSRLFHKCKAFDEPLTGWDTSNVVDMSYMFSNAVLFHQPIGHWVTSNVRNMRCMFHRAAQFNQPIGQWDVSNVRDMSHMFAHTLQFDQPLGTWDVGNVRDMSHMFSSALRFNQPLGTWDVGNVRDMSHMFAHTMQFDQPVGTWDVSNVRDMSHMFSSAMRFNQPLGTWDVGNVQDMKHMFAHTMRFNQPLGTWDVSNVRDMSHMFSSAKFDQPIGNWDTSNVRDMSHMFSSALRFNQPIGQWVTCSTQDMTHMFARATQFNHPIDTWDVRNVQRLGGMFAGATEFNQSLGRWHTLPVECYDDPPMFAGAPWMLRRYPDGIITPNKSPRERWAKARRRVQSERDPRRFRWQRLCDTSALHVDELRALATASHVPGAADLSKRALCAALSQQWAAQRHEQSRVAPDCNNRVGLMQAPVEDIPPEFFYSYEQDGLRYCDDIRDLNEYVQARPRAENPYTNVPYDAATLGGIRAAYALVSASAERMDDFDDEPASVLPFQTQLTQKLADLMSKLHYPNDLELFRRASSVQFSHFVDGLLQSGVVSPNDRARIDAQADLDQQKMVLVDLLWLKIAHDPEQTQTAHGPISRIAYEVSTLYNDLFV